MPLRSEQETSYEPLHGQSITDQWNTGFTTTVYTQNPDAVISFDQTGNKYCRCYKGECQETINGSFKAVADCTVLNVLSTS